MSNKTFMIHFITSENFTNSGGRSGKLIEYEAIVTTMSKSLALYKVSNIHSISEKDQIKLQKVYYLTSYPLQNQKHDKWIDPITLTTNNFIQILGETIEMSHTYKVKLLS